MVAYKARVQKGNGMGGRFSLLLLAGIFLGIIGYLAFSDWKIYQTRAALQERIQILQQEMQKLEQRNAELERLLAKIGTEEYAEETARERLNLKKPGEEVIVVLPPEQQQQQEEIQPSEKNFLQKIIDKILRLRD